MKLSLLKEDGTKVIFKNTAKGISGFIILLNFLFDSENINIRILFEKNDKKHQRVNKNRNAKKY